MTVSTFLKVFIKILGLWLSIQFASVFVQNILGLVYSGIEKDSVSIYNSNVYLIISTVITTFSYCLLIFLFLFKTDFLLNKLKMEKNFAEQQIEIKMDAKSILNIAIIIMGGIVFIDSFPLLLKDIYFYYTQSGELSNKSDSFFIFYNLVRNALGYVLLAYNKKITNFFLFEKE